MKSVQLQLLDRELADMIADLMEKATATLCASFTVKA